MSKPLAGIAILLSAMAFGHNKAAHEPLQVASPQSDELTCVLSAARNGQTVTVRGKVRNGAHDMAFDVSGCNTTVLLTFAGDKDNDVSASELRQDAELRRFQKYTGSVYKSTRKSACAECAKYGDVEAELTGKLEVASMPPGATKDALGFIRDESGKTVGRFGWGHPIPFASYRLVIESATDVKAQKLPPPK